MTENSLLVPLTMANSDFVYKFGFIDLLETFAFRLSMHLNLGSQPSLKLGQLALRLSSNSEFIGLCLVPEFFDGGLAALTLMQGFTQVLCIIVIFIFAIKPVIRLSCFEIVQGVHVQVVIFEREDASHMGVKFTDFRQSKHFDHVCRCNEHCTLGEVARTAHHYCAVTAAPRVVVNVGFVEGASDLLAGAEDAATFTFL